MALFGNLKPRDETGTKPQSETAPRVKASSGLYGGLTSLPPGTVPAPVEAKPNYFYDVDQSGNSFGFSQEEKDASGRPFFAFRKPGDTSTTTDKTRVATPFDPRKAAPVTRDSFYNTRAVANVAAIKKEMGGAYSDELDHRIALALSGSNDKANLKPIPAEQNQKFGSIEEEYQHKVISGQMSLFDAQIALAKKKGIPLPFTGAAEKKGFIDRILGGVRSLYEKGKENVKPQETAAATTEAAPGLYSNLTSPGEPAFKVTPSISGPADNRVANSTQAVPDQNAPDTVGFLKSLVSGQNEVRAPFAKAEQKSTVGGGKLVSSAVDMTSRLLEVIPKATVVTAANIRETSAAIKGEEPSPVKLSFDSTRLGFDRKDAVGNMVWSSGQRMADDFNARMDANPKTPIWNIVSSVFAGPITDAFDATVAGDLGASAARAVLERTGYNRATLDALTRFDVNPRELASLSPSTARETVVNQAKDKITSLMEKYRPELEAGGPLPDSFVKELNHVSDDLYEIGRGYFNTPNMEIGPIGTFARKVADTLTKPIESIGKEASFKVGAEGAERLPGYRKEPGQAPAFGLSTERVEPVGQAAKKQPETFDGFKDITTNVLNKLEGKSSVSKQYISDLTNMPELKQAERDIIRNVLNEYPEGKDIAVKEFADKVRSELLPIEDGSERTRSDNAMYESTTLPDELRGPIKDYKENVYTSPIKTSAGDVHGFTEVDNYFAHTRTEDLPDNTRRIIEVQSDLFQKGRLEAEKAQAEKPIFPMSEKTYGSEGRNAELAKLEPYRNTWHERIIREEIKKAAKAGKSTLQFPTGETAMKIEGLGDNTQWLIESATRPAQPHNLSVGRSIYQNDEEDEWIITDVLGDGKFKAVPRDQILTPRQVVQAKNVGSINPNTEHLYGKIGKSYYLKTRSESFDISGKVDTENPIYRFYEKTIGQYLKRFGAEKVTDKQGVSWWQMKVDPAAAEKPVTAFKKEIGDFTPNISKEVAEDLLYSIFNKDELRLVFDPDLLKEEGALGVFRQGTSKYSSSFSAMIRLLEVGGKVDDRVLYHEAFHAYFNKFLTSSERGMMIARVKNNILAARHKFYPDEVYDTVEKKAEEWLADDFADYVKSKAGGEEYKGFFRRQWEKFMDAVRKLIRKKEQFDKLYEDILSKRRAGGEANAGTRKSAAPEELRPDRADVEKGSKEIDKELVKESKKNKAPSEAETHYEAAKIRKEGLMDILKMHPGRKLAMYANKNGELPEVLGKGDGKFGRSGDEFASELGYPDSEAARADYQNYKNLQKRFAEAYKNFNEARVALRAERLAAKDQRGMDALMNKTANKTEKDVSAQDRAANLKKQVEEAQKRLLKESLDAELAKKTREKIVRDAAKEARQKTGLVQKIKTALGPIGQTDPKTIDIYKSWQGKRLAAKEAADKTYEALKNVEPGDFNEILAYQAGKKTPWIFDTFESLWTEAKRRGLEPRHREDYIPQIYKEPPAVVDEAIAKYMEAKGATKEEVAAYMAGDELPPPLMIKLKMKPFFTKARVFPDYVTAMAHGLTPRFMTVAEHVAYYREEMEKVVANKEMIDSFIKEGKFLDSYDAPANWEEVKIPGQGRRQWYADPKLARALTEQFDQDRDLSLVEYIFKYGGDTSSLIRNIITSGGVPFTPVNLYGLGQLKLAAAKGVGRMIQGSPREGAGMVKDTIGAFFRAFSDNASSKWFQDRAEFAELAEKYGSMDFTSRVGHYDDLRDSFRELFISKKTYKELGTSIADGFQGTWDKAKRLTSSATKIRSFSAAKKLFGVRAKEEVFDSLRRMTHSRAMQIFGDQFDTAVNRKTFRSFIPMMRLESFIRIYKQAFASGLSKEDAASFAGTVVNKGFGGVDQLGRSKLVQDVARTFLFSPRHTESMVRMFSSSIMATANPYKWKDPTYRDARAVFFGVAAVFVIYQMINYALNDEFTWENEAGREFDIKVRMPDDQLMYVTFFPSVFSTPRNITAGALALANGDWDTATQKFGAFTGAAMKTVLEVISNQDYFGRPIYDDTDSADDRAKKIAAYLGVSVSHPIVRELWRYGRGDETLYQAGMLMAEMPVKFSNLTKAQQSEWYDAQEKLQAKRSKIKDNEIRPIYDELQKLKGTDREQEAIDRYNALPEGQKILYNEILSDEKRKATTKRKAAMSALYEELKKMSPEEANKKYWALPESDRNVMDSVIEAAKEAQKIGI
jgi:hypothetical protein